MSAGKGDLRRPSQITEQEFASRWVRVFGTAGSAILRQDVSERPQRPRHGLRPAGTGPRKAPAGSGREAAARAIGQLEMFGPDEPAGAA